jgi:hypothetical protein
MYQGKTLSGATRRVRQLEKQIAERDATIEACAQAVAMLAKLAAKGPAFFSPLAAMEAEKLRDKILDILGMNPDGTFQKGPRHD